MAIGEAVFQQQLTANLGAVLPLTVVKAILAAGVTDWRSLVNSSELAAATQQYSKSVTRVFVSC